MQLPEPLKQSKPNYSGLTYAQAAIDNRIQNHHFNIPALIDQPEGHRPKELQELQSMLRGFMEQMSTMLLITLVSKMSQ